MKTEFTIKQTKVRESNFELLRIIAMFMVLILHADFQALGAPDKIEIITHPIAATLKVILEMASIVAVNVFILISGWFGIRPSVKGFIKFIFQVLFFSLGIYIIVLIKGDIQFSFKGLADCFAMMGEGYWFITSYLCLYILSPILNNFIDNSDKYLYRNILIGFYVFQTLYGFCSTRASFFVDGYSVVSFVGLYMLAGYIRRYVDILRHSKKIYLVIYAFCTCILTLIYLLSIHFDVPAISFRIGIYSNPIVILSALSLLLLFAQIKIQNRVINWIGSSSFAVYLLHTNSNIYEPYYINVLQNMKLDYTLLSLLTVLVYVIIWFVLGVLLDKLREKCYTVIARGNYKCHRS